MSEFMLAKEYTKDMKFPKNVSNYNPPIGWLCSEKFDGYRAQYINEKKQFISRNGKLFNAPEWFINSMPDIHMDGELFAGRENFQDMGVVRKKVPVPDEWRNIKYVVYDLPTLEDKFSIRIQKLKDIINNHIQNWNKIKLNLPVEFQSINCPIVFADQIPINSIEQMETIYKDILKKGGEGIMIKDPDSFYEDKRSNFMLKYKPNFDAEAIIVDYKFGNGKYSNMLGGFVCKPLINKDSYHVIDNNENHEFSTSGMNDEIRENYKLTHPIGTIITFEHSGKTDSGKPRFPRYVRTRKDIIIKEETIIKSTKKKERIINIFNHLHKFEKSNGEHFKAKSYSKAIISLRDINDDSELTHENLIKMNGIGKSLLEKINNIIETDTCNAYEKIKNLRDPRELFMQIHAVGSVAANKLVKSGFKTIDDLRSCENIQDHLNDKQIIGLKYYDDLIKRIPKSEIKKHEKLLNQILKMVDSSAELTIAGSYRRKKKDSGDIDVLLKCKTIKTYKSFIQRLHDFNYLVEHLAEGNKKYNGICKFDKTSIPRRIDIMFTKPDEYPFAILYFTGSAEFNLNMRKNLLDQNLSINEYSLKYNDTKQKVNHTFNTEKDIFDYLKIEYVEPQNR